MNLPKNGIAAPRCKVGVDLAQIKVTLTEEQLRAAGPRLRVAWPCFARDRDLCPACPHVRPRSEEQAAFNRSLLDMTPGEQRRAMRARLKARNASAADLADAIE